MNNPILLPIITLILYVGVPVTFTCITSEVYADIYDDAREGKLAEYEGGMPLYSSGLGEKYELDF